MKSSLSQITLLISLLLISTSLSHTLASKHTTTTNFIKSSCTTTTNPKLCYSTLSLYASEIRTNPKALATKSLFIALSEARAASRAMGRLLRVRGLRPKEAGALSVCSMSVGYSAGQLQRAFQEMGHGPAGGPTSEMVVSNVQTWTSTALTYEGTCMDGFRARETTNRNVQIMVRRRIGKLIQLTSNALALVNGYASSRNAHHNHNHNNP